MTRNQQAFIYATCFIVFGLVMGGLWWLASGITDDFGMGVAVGFAIGAGGVFLASRQARDAP